MYKLERRRFSSVHSLFAGMDYNLVVDSIIEGNTPAHVWVDQPDEPAVALMWNRQDALLLAGVPRDETTPALINQLLRERIVPEARQRYIPQLALHYTPSAWDSRIVELLAGFDAEKALRRYYQYAPRAIAWREQLPDRYEMLRIDEQALADKSLAHSDDMRGWVLSFWESASAFAEKGVGYYLAGRDQIASWCLSVYAAGNQQEFGLATAPESRGRGFATLTAAACLEHCVEQGLTPHWHCWEDNLASIAVAEKVGFEHPTIYPVYRLTL